MAEKTHLDPSLTLRRAHWADLNAVAKLTHDVAQMEGDASFVMTAEELANAWHNEGFLVERDVFVVETRDGRIVGSEEFYNENDHCKFKADGCVHPEFRGLGIGTSLLEKVNERAQVEMKLAEPNARVFIQTTFNNKDEAGHALLKTENYFPIRYHWRMEIKMQVPPAAATFPDGIELRSFIKHEHAVAIWQANNEAFRDHWGSHEWTYEDWSHLKFGNPNFDPTLWMIAWDGDEIAGFSQNEHRKGMGWIGTIGVRRPWRKRGLGLALLYYSFGEFYKRGITTIGLGVDASNPTGATRVYQRAGMYAASEFVKFEKELRAGNTESNDTYRGTMNTTLEKPKVELPKGFTIRGANINDVEPALRLFNTWSQSVIQQDDVNDAGAIRNEWVSPGFDPARDIRLAFSPDKEMVGYVEVWTTAKPPVHPWIWGRVHPTFGGLGIGTWLLQWAEERACKVLDELPADLRVAPRVGIYRQAKDSKKLFEDMGFMQIRSSYEMQIDMDETPPTPLWADGITLKVADPEKDLKVVYEAVKESFRDHFGYVEEPFEKGFARFKHFMLGDGSDPSLWFLAMDGGEIAGICLCRPKSYNDPQVGYVNTLGVRRAWRKRGVGLALLRHSFGEFYRRGSLKVGLGVDAENLTGALRLYEKAGMHVHQTFDLFEKTVRSGREISVESLLE